MIKFFSVTFLSLFIFSCGSIQTQDNAPLEKLPVREKDTKSTASKTDAVSNGERKTAPIAPIAVAQPSRQDELEQAILTGDDERIKKVSLDLLQINSKNYKALNALAMYHYKKRQYEASVLLLNKALDVNPKASEVYNNYGLIELAKNNKKEALIMFRKALEANSDNHFAAANAGAIYVKEMDYSKAVSALEKSASKGKAGFESLNNYAIALTATGKINEAGDIYEKILDENQDNKAYMLNYAILLIDKQQKFKEGLDLINRLKFVGMENESRQVIKYLENKAKAGLK